MATNNLSKLLNPVFRPLSRVPRGRSRRVELHAIPPLLRAADLGFMAEWGDGWFALAGHSVQLVDGSPFAVKQAPDAWLAALHGFGWLRHVPSDMDAETERGVQELVAGWLSSGAARTIIAFGDAVTVRRVLSWLGHADLLLQTADERYYDAVLRGLMADVELLARRWRLMEAAGGRLLALVALAQAGLCLADADDLRQEAEAALNNEFNGRSGSAKGELFRDPDLLAEVLLDLEALRLLYAMRALAAPPIVVQAKTEILGALEALLLGDGRPARLGSARDDHESKLTLASVMRHVGTTVVEAAYIQAAGIGRLVLGETCVVADVGAPFGSVDALGLEMSSGVAPLLSHDGLDASRAQAGRGALIISTPPRASTPPPASGRMPTLVPTHSVNVELDDAALLSLDATHAGHAKRGFVHRRRVVLTQEGRQLDGIDELRPLVSDAVPDEVDFLIRFVLHPTVEVVLVSSPDQLDLRLANDHCWRFMAPARVLSVESAVFRDGLKTTPTLQILVPANTASNRTVAWQLVRVDGGR